MEEIKAVNLENVEGNIIDKNSIYLLVCSIALGLLFDLLFYGKSLGISYPLYTIALYGALFWNMRGSSGFRLDSAWLLGIPIMALSFTYLIFSNMIFTVLNFIAVPVLLAAHTIILTSKNKYRWYDLGFILDLIYGMTVRPLINITKPFSIIKRIVRRKYEPGKFAVAGKVLTGLLISVPLLLVIISLLASADQVFNHLIGQIPNIFEGLSINEFIARLIIIIIVTCTLFSYLWSLSDSKTAVSESVIKEGHIKTGRFIDAITSATILVLMDFLYVIFIAIQFSYLFGSLSFGLPESFTYAQYARRGFFELVAVTMINLLILLGSINFMKSASAVIDKTVKILKSVLVGCTLVMLFSAHFRMALYEEAYGYTYLRVLTHAFMIYLFALFAVTLYKIWKEKFPLLKTYIVVSIVAYTLINYVNVDSIIVKNNIQRYTREHEIDAFYLTTLSYDAVPQLVEFMNNNKADTETIIHIENGLVNKKKMLERNESWQSFNISRYRAKKVLSGQNLIEHPVDTENLRMRSDYPETER